MTVLSSNNHIRLMEYSVGLPNVSGYKIILNQSAKSIIRELKRT